MIELENLQLGYGQKPLLLVPSFSIAAGEHCLILGKSGAGKTTLLYALAGLLTPMRGRLRIGDVEPHMLDAPARDTFRGQHISIIYQTLHMVPALTVLENLLLVQYAAGVKQDVTRAEQLLARLGLSQYRDSKPEALSQGQQQRVAIARAAMNAPSIILGDEPTSALDDESCAQVIELLLQVAQESGASLVVATHDARLKPYFSKQLALGGIA